MRVSVSEGGLSIVILNVVVDVVKRTVGGKGVKAEEEKVIEASDSRQGDVEGAMGEGAFRYVDCDASEGLPLGFVGSDCPAKFQGELVDEDLFAVSKAVAD